jgi:hypothetical protein
MGFAFIHKARSRSESAAVRMKYVCPQCTEAFSRWAKCKQHLLNSDHLGPLRAQYGPSVDTWWPDGIQARCVASKTGAPKEKAPPQVRAEGADASGFQPAQRCSSADTARCDAQKKSSCLSMAEVMERVVGQAAASVRSTAARTAMMVQVGEVTVESAHPPASIARGSDSDSSSNSVSELPPQTLSPTVAALFRGG